MGAGRRGFAAAAVATALLPLLAGAAYSDCFDSCYNNCVSNDKSMRDYCNYACDKTCTPDDGRVNPPPVRDDDPFMNCQLVCVRASCLTPGADGDDDEICYEHCFSSCTTRPPHAFRPAALPPHHPFHKKQGAVRQVAALPDHPFRKEERAVWPRPAALPDRRPFHRKQGAAAARPAALIDHTYLPREAGCRQADGEAGPG